MFQYYTHCVSQALTTRTCKMLLDTSVSLVANNWLLFVVNLMFVQILISVHYCLGMFETELIQITVS